ncbi:MAG: repressor LexA [Acidobacteria bacterium RIFCSPLOWO2_12_FULL_60_22]|nr:MAG: repressor LexA [Acidobacteria bacterium RIFCSPLOWO2_12_FULL_60_22]
MVLTRRQREVMDYIADFLREHGYSPSFQEIARGMGLSSLATVHKHVLTLERKGFLRRGYNQSRSIEPGPRYLQEARRARQDRARAELPLLGRIAAGQPVEALEQPSTISLGDFTGNKDVFVLQVKGDSMIEEHILDGDYILVEKTGQVADGDIAVALLGGSESTLKRFYREPDGRVRLQPANARLKPLVVPAAEVTVQGRVIGVLRRY